MDDDDNLAKWEENKLTASDRRTLLANWYYKAVLRALEARGRRQDQVLPARGCPTDGTDDDLIKLEGTPYGYNKVI